MVRAGFAGGIKDGRILEISGGLNVIKPILSGQVQAPHKLGVAGGHAGLEPGTIPQKTPTGKPKVSPPGVRDLLLQWANALTIHWNTESQQIHARKGNLRLSSAGDQ